MCKQCETKPVYEFTNQRKLCKTCFVRWFQKKVLYTIRKFELIKSGEVVGYTKTNNFRSVVLEKVLKMFAEKTRVEIIKLPARALQIDNKINKKNSAVNNVSAKSRAECRLEAINDRAKRGKLKLNKIAIASTTDLEADKIIHALIKNGKLSSAVEGKIIKPLYLFLDKEVLLYAKLKNLAPKGVPPMQDGILGGKIKKDEISKFIDELEKTHPEVKQAVVGSYLGN